MYLDCIAYKNQDLCFKHFGAFCLFVFVGYVVIIENILNIFCFICVRRTKEDANLILCIRQNK